MDRFDKDDEIIVDAEFSESNSNLFNDESINGKPLYYTCKQVAQIVGENESTIRYWAKAFEPILKIEVSNMVKKYTKTNIENLLFIRKLLKEDGLTVKQAFDYCSKKGFNSEEGLIDTGMPLAIKTFTKAVMVEMNKRFDTIQEEMNKNNELQKESFSKIIKTMIEIEPNLKDSLSQAIDQVMTDKMNDIDDSLKNIKDELNFTKDELVTNLRDILNEKHKIEESNKANKKGFFNRLFKR